MGIAVLNELEHEIHQVILSGSQLLHDNFRLRRLQAQLSELRSYAKPLALAADLLLKLLEDEISETVHRIPDLMRLASLVQAMQVALCEPPALPIPASAESTPKTQPETQTITETGLTICGNQNALSGILLHRAREALKTKGSGRLETLLRLHTPPLYLRQRADSATAAAQANSLEASTVTSTAYLDLRLILPLLQGLNDDYSEIRDLCFAWLHEFGPALLPLLEQRIETFPKGRGRERLIELHKVIMNDAQTTSERPHPTWDA